jgi:predicted P-loop ATPase/GTPase
MNTYDSGKTEVAKQLVSELSEMGYKTEYFKPFSGHNYWYRYEHSKECLKKGTIFSHDAAYIRSGYQSDNLIEIANPVHRIYTPLKHLEPREILLNSLALGGENSVFALERITSVADDRIESTYLVASDLIENGYLSIDKSFIEHVISNSQTINVNSLEEVHQFEAEKFETAVDSCYKMVEKDKDITIIEAFNDTVWPWQKLESVDLVMAVRPGELILYNPERVKKAVRVIDNKRNRIREITFNRVSEYLKTENHIVLKPGIGLEQNDIISFISGILKKE